MAVTYEVNSTTINAGIQATWPPIETGENADATQKINTTWYNHIWRAETMEMTEFQIIEPLKGSAFTELKSTGQAVPNTGDTFATGKVMDVQGRQVGRQMKNVVVRFLVDVTVTPPTPGGAGLDVIEANFNGVWLESYFTYGGPDEAVSLDEVKFFDC